MKLSDKKFAAGAAAPAAPRRLSAEEKSALKSDDTVSRIAQMIGQLPESSVKDMITSFQNSGMNEDQILQQVSQTGLAGDMQVGESAKKVLDIMKSGPDSPAGMAGSPGNFTRDSLSTEEVEGTSKIGQALPPPPAPGAPPPQASPPGAEMPLPAEEGAEDGPPVYERSLAEVLEGLAADSAELKERIEAGETLLEGQSMEPVTDDAGFSPDPFESKVAGPLDDEDDYLTTDKTVREFPPEQKKRVLEDFYTKFYPRTNYTDADVERLKSTHGDTVQVGTPKQYKHLTVNEKRDVDTTFRRETTPGDIDLLKSVDDLARQDLSNERRRQERAVELAKLKEKREQGIDPNVELESTPFSRERTDIDKSLSEVREKTQKNYDPFGQKLVRPNPIRDTKSRPESKLLKNDPLARKTKVNELRKMFKPMPTKEMKVEHEYKNIPLSRDEIEKNVNPIINEMKQKDPSLTKEELLEIKRDLMKSYSTADFGKADPIYKKVAPEVLKYEFYDTEEDLAEAEQLAKEWAADPAHSYGKTVKIIEVARDAEGNPIPATEEYRDNYGNMQTRPMVDEDGEPVYKPKVTDDALSPQEALAEHEKKMLQMKNDPSLASREKWFKRMTEGGLDTIKTPTTADGLSDLHAQLSQYPTAQEHLKNYFEQAKVVAPGPEFTIAPTSSKIVTSFLSTPKFKSLMELLKSKAKQDIENAREKAKTQDEKYKKFDQIKNEVDHSRGLADPMKGHVPGLVQNMQSPVLRDKAMREIKTEMAKNKSSRPSVDQVMSMDPSLRSQFLKKDEQSKLLTRDDDAKSESARVESEMNALNKQINSLQNKYKTEHAQLAEMLQDNPSLKNDTDFISKFFETENKAGLIDSLNRDPSMDVSMFGPEIEQLKDSVSQRNVLRDQLMTLKKPNENLKQTFDNRLRQRQVGTDPLASVPGASPEVRTKAVEVKNRLSKMEGVIKDLESKLKSDVRLKDDPAFTHHLKEEMAARDMARSELSTMLKAIPPPPISDAHAAENAATPPMVIPKSDPEALEEFLKAQSDKRKAQAAAQRAKQRGADYDLKREQEMRKILESAPRQVSGAGPKTDDILSAMGAQNQWTEDTIQTMKKLDYLNSALNRSMTDKPPLGTANYEDPLVQAAVARYGNEWSSKALKMTKGTPSYSRKKHLEDSGRMDALLPLDLVLKLDQYRKANGISKLSDALPGLSPDEIDLAYDILRGYVVETNRIANGIISMQNKEKGNKMKKGSALAFDELVVADAITTVEDCSSSKIASSSLASIFDFLSSDAEDRLTSDSDMQIAAMVADPSFSRVAATAIIGYLTEFGDKMPDVLLHDRLSVYQSAIAKIPELAKTAAGLKMPKIKSDHSDAVDVDGLSDKADDDEEMLARPAHIKFEITDSEKVGSYAIVDIEWDPSEDSACGVGMTAMKQALRSFMKGQESNKNFLDWGFTGKMTVESIDMASGEATIVFATDKGADSPQLVKTK